MSKPECFLGPGVRPGAPTCRLIADDDLDAVADLLARGFPARTVGYWRAGLAFLRRRPCHPDQPRYGYVLEDHGRLVGVLLALFAPGRPPTDPRCHLSSWYVEPTFRFHAIKLVHAALAERQATTYFNVSPAPHTLRLHVAMGFHALNEDSVLAAPWLGPPRPGVRIERFCAARHADCLASPALTAVAEDHEALGCRALVAIEAGRAQLFIFQRKPLPGLKHGAAHVIFTPSMEALTRLAGPLGRALWRHGFFVLKMDGAAVPRGLVGRHVKGRSPRWSRGPSPPAPNDLTYTELAIFGP